ncbi:MAG: hypothetical protein V1915_05080 [Candidatus Bathyarchaeota archaeon]
MSSDDVLRDALNSPVGQSMRESPVTVSSGQSIVDLMYHMYKDRIGAVIVEEEGADPRVQTYLNKERTC